MANRFRVGGTSNWDGTTGASANWSTTTGGGGGASGPGTSDIAIFDALSGGGTVTVTGTIAVQQITCGAFTGTLDFSANNNNVTLSSTSTGLSLTGTGTRTVNLGNGTWTFSAAAGNPTIIDATNITNLTFNANSSVLLVTGGAAAGTVARNFTGGGLTYATLQIAASASYIAMTGTNTFATLTMTGQSTLGLFANQTITTLNLTGTSGNEVFFSSSAMNTQRTITVTTLNSAFAAFRAIAFSGSGLSSSNSIDLGNNSGATITAPSSAGGISRARAAAGF